MTLRGIARNCVPALLLTVLLAAALAGPPEPDGVERDVVYGKAGDMELKLDLARPASGAGPFPAIVMIHGGGWRNGDKKAYIPVLRRFADAGYVGASVNYRLTPAHRFPAQVEDVKCAVRYLRERAQELKIDPDRIGALGHSAGGHLALMLGALGASDGLEGTGGHADRSSRVTAVVNYFGPADLAREGPGVVPGNDPAARQKVADLLDELLRDLLGTADRKDPAMAKASPVTYLTADDAPVLTFHGTEDLLVPVEQARILHDALRKAGVSERLEILEGEGHGWKGEAVEKTNRIAFEFLEKHLR